MHTGLVYLCECDHTDDLEAYAADVRTAGATITQMSAPRNGRAIMAVTVADPSEFQEKLNQSDAGGFATFSVVSQENIDRIMKGRG